MVSPEIVTLSVFSTPCTKPTSIHARPGGPGRPRRRRTGRRTAPRPPRPPGGAGRWRGRPAGAAGRCRRSRRPGPGVLEAADAQVAARDPGEDGAGQHVSRWTPRPVATTASERVVGMPRACIASLMTYSRSIGPTAARPSPPRANGVRPEPLRCRSRRRPSAVGRARRAAARGRRRAAGSSRRTGGPRRPGRPGGRPGRPRCRRAGRARRGAQPVRVEPQLGGHLLVEHQQPGFGASSACQGRASSGSSRAKR